MFLIFYLLTVRGCKVVSGKGPWSLSQNIIIDKQMGKKMGGAKLFFSGGIKLDSNCTPVLNFCIKFLKSLS